jgi:hypothetical protein
MSLPDLELQPLTCCILNCGRTLKVIDGGQGLEKGWDVEQDGDGKEYALCPTHRFRQEAQDERTSQRMGKPPQEITEAIKVEKASDAEIRKVISDAEKGIVRPVSVEPILKVNQSNICIKARFKLIALEVVCGDQVISNIELTPEIKAKLNISEEICQVL